MKALLPILALTLLAVSGCTRSQAAASPADPSNAEAAALLERACTTCHDLGCLNAFANSYGESQWRGLIDTMISYGATVSPSEADTLARYLALNYGTGQMATPEDTAQAAALFQTACTTCHGADAITTSPTTWTAAAFRTAVERMRTYGAAVAENQVDMLVAYLVETYGE
jgi:cytochrome c5